MTLQSQAQWMLKSEYSKTLHLMHTIPYSFTLVTILIKTHGSESWGQEEAGLHDEPVSYLQVAPL